MSQTKIIAGILEREGKISNFRCIHERISLRLAARILDLKQKGWKIETKEQDNKDTVYVLVAKPAPRQLVIA